MKRVKEERSLARAFVQTPIGGMIVEADGTHVRGICFSGRPDGPGEPDCPNTPAGAGALLSKAERELEEYFSGGRTSFSVPLLAEGTPFQQAVWQFLTAIPYGETATYGQIAARLGRPGAARAVGMACNRNPIAIIIPCHRVVGADGGLTGYAGGLDVKARLLLLEQERKNR